MSDKSIHSLSDEAKTLLLPLYIRAIESQRPDALIKDEKAVALIGAMNFDSSWFKQMRIDEDDQAAIALRNREFDRFARDFLAHCPEAAIVHIGCGLDSRFERVDNGEVVWYDLDLPDVIELRRKLIGEEEGRYHLLSCSVFDSAWFEAVKIHRQRPFLFLAEGVLMYFEGNQVKSLVLTLRDQFPGAELVFDAFAPYIVRLNNLRIARTKIGARYHWGLSRGRDIERWGDEICLLDEWRYFDHFEPRLAHTRWVRHIPPLAKASGIFHYQLGLPATEAIAEKV